MVPIKVCSQGSCIYTRQVFAQKCHSELSFWWHNIHCAPSGEELHCKMPKVTAKMIKESETEEDVTIDTDDDEDTTMETGIHSVINLLEAKYDIQCLDEALNDVKTYLDTG